MTATVISKRLSLGEAVSVHPEASLEFDDGLLYGLQRGEERREYVFVEMTRKNGGEIPTYDGGIVVGKEPAYGGKITIHLLVPKSEYKDN